MSISSKSEARVPKIAIFEIFKCTGMGKWMNVAKSTDYIKNCFKQKLFRIKFVTKNSVDAYLYLPQDWR